MQNQIPKNWQKDNLENLLDILIDHRGITPKKLGGGWSASGIPALSAKNIKTGKIVNEKDIRFVSQKLYEEWMPEKLEGGDVLLTSEAPLGELYFLKEKRDYVLSQRLFALRTNKKKLNSRYLYYYLQGSIGRQELLRRLSGTAAEGIRQVELRQIIIEFPEDVLQQEKIISVISAFDDKIEVNNKIAKTLEEIAQALLKEWFVNFRFPGYEKAEFVDSELGKIPDGWEIISLKDIVDLISDRYIGNNNKDRIPYLPIDLIQPKTLLLKETAPTEEAKSSLIKFIENDILFGAMRPYFFKVSIAPFIGLSRTTCFVFRPKVKGLLGYATFFLFRQETIDYATNLSQGSTIPYARWNGALAEMNLLKPSPELLQLFNMIALPVIENIKSIYFENQKLTTLRDLLLPKLMRGEIRV